MGRGETVEYAGVQVDPRYRWRNDTLIQRFGITQDEERQLTTIVSQGEAGVRGAMEQPIDLSRRPHQQRSVPSMRASLSEKQWRSSAWLAMSPSSSFMRWSRSSSLP